MSSGAVVAIDILAILICFIIFYGTIFQTKASSRCKNSLALLVGFLILLLVSDMSLEFVGPSSPVWLVRLLLVISGAGEFVNFGLLIHYIYDYIIDTENKKNLIIRAVILYCIVAFVVSAVLIALDEVTFIDGVLEEGRGSQICEMLGWGTYALLLIALLVSHKTLSTLSGLIFGCYVFLPLVFYLAGNYFKLEISFDHEAMSIVIVLVYVFLQSKIYLASEKEKELYFKTVSSVYQSMHMIDMVNLTFSEFGAKVEIRNYIEKHSRASLQDLFWGVMSVRISDAYMKDITDFTDLSTLELRMKDKKSIDIEVINIDNEWYRFTFFRVGDVTSKLEKVIFTSQDIDGRKRRENELLLTSNTDALTQANNRYAYENDMAQINESGIGFNLWYLLFDLNGLKVVNDSRGHKAGDEIIVAMAKGLGQVFSKYGKVYRIGGDEFVAIIRGTKDEVERSIDKLKKYRDNWEGKYLNTFSYSLGYVCSSELPEGDMLDIEKEADKRMYVEKSAYHRRHMIED